MRNTLLVKAIETERWRKWMVGDQVNLTVEQILADHKLSLDILDISGHYAFNDDEVKAATEHLYKNLAQFNIDGQRFVVDHICALFASMLSAIGLRELLRAFVRHWQSKHVLLPL